MSVNRLGDKVTRLIIREQGLASIHTSGHMSAESRLNKIENSVTNEHWPIGWLVTDVIIIFASAGLPVQFKIYNYTVSRPSNRLAKSFTSSRKINGSIFFPN
jgi:hypothetical protein